MKRMLFNATHPEELRVAIVDGQRLIDLDIESAVRVENKGNIYKAVVTKVEPGLEAAFVDYGAERQGFLPLKEIYRGYFTKYDSKTPISSVKIAQEIKEGQEMIVQVSKDERSGKGAALSTFISLAGRFLVLMPNNPKGGGISRRAFGEERAGLREVLANLDVGDRHALIARTAGIGRNREELQWDLDFLLKLWETIEAANAEIKAPRLIYQESNLIVRSIRDHFAEDIAEVVIDDGEIYERARRFMQTMMPHNLKKLRLYEDTTPLFSRYQIEQQIGSAFKRHVSLPSGGLLVIDHTEALISVDVNSARATKGADIEETALQTNLESVEELARQLRIRDLGGLVVIDLIDMGQSRNQRAVETRLKESLRHDRARVQIGKISRFGLLEMSRQRLRSSINDVNYRVCPRCEGTGVIRGVVSSSLSLLRQLEERAMQDNTEALRAVLPVDMATYLLNEKRREIGEIEARCSARIVIIPSADLASPQFEIKRLRNVEIAEIDNTPSFEQKVEVENDNEEAAADMQPAHREKPHIQIDQLSHRAVPRRAVGFGWLKKLFGLLRADKPKPPRQAGGRRPGARPASANRRPPRRRNDSQRTRNDNRPPHRTQGGGQGGGQGGQNRRPQSNRNAPGGQNRRPQPNRGNPPRDAQQKSPRDPQNKPPRDSQRNPDSQGRRDPRRNFSNTTQQRDSQMNRPTREVDGNVRPPGELPDDYGNR